MIKNTNNIFNIITESIIGKKILLHKLCKDYGDGDIVTHYFTQKYDHSEEIIVEIVKVVWIKHLTIKLNFNYNSLNQAIELSLKNPIIFIEN